MPNPAAIAPLSEPCHTPPAERLAPAPCRAQSGRTAGKGKAVPLGMFTRADGRAVRIIKCLRLLEGDCYSVDDLAVHFCVSRRTVYRDLRLMAAAGVRLMRRTGDRCYHAPASRPP